MSRTTRSKSTYLQLQIYIWMALEMFRKNWEKWKNFEDFRPPCSISKLKIQQKIRVLFCLNYTYILKLRGIDYKMLIKMLNSTRKHCSLYDSIDPFNKFSTSFLQPFIRVIKLSITLKFRRNINVYTAFIETTYNEYTINDIEETWMNKYISTKLAWKTPGFNATQGKFILKWIYRHKKNSKNVVSHRVHNLLGSNYIFSDMEPAELP